MPIDLDVLEAVKEMDEHDLRRLLILAQARLEGKGVRFTTNAPTVRLRKQLIKCGKGTCSRCPHGPYWYAYWSEDGRRRSRYLGRLDPDDGEESINLDTVPADEQGVGRRKRNAP